MKLKRFLNEEIEEPEKLLGLLKKDCKEYLQLLHRNNIKYPFSKGIILAVCDKKSVQASRKPKGTNPKVFVTLNKWLEENGHVRRDHCIITTPVMAYGNNFGHPVYIFPIGNIEYTWCPSPDFNYSSMYFNMSPGFMTGWYNYMVQHSTKNETKDFLDRHGDEMFITNKDLDIAFNKGYETWWKCNQYYTVPIQTHYAEIYKELGLKYEI